MEELNLRLVADPLETRKWFAIWLAALEDGADADDWGWYLPEERLWFRRLQPEASILITEFSSIASGISAIVQINEPRAAGREDGLSGIAVDRTGRHHLVRQGILHRNARSERVDVEFGARTGLQPIAMRRGGGAASRDWYHVTPLEGLDSSAIRTRTAAFVEACWTARTWDAQAASDSQRLTGLLGGQEQGGSSWITPDPTPREVRRTQGYVWRSLYDALSEYDVEMTKPRHARGYEVDAEVQAPGGPILVEIKTTLDASAIYTGVGQLTLYPILLPDLATHERVLLLPGIPQPALGDALRQAGVTVHGYILAGEGEETHVTFDDAFLKRCGAADQSSG